MTKIDKIYYYFLSLYDHCDIMLNRGWVEPSTEEFWISLTILILILAANIPMLLSTWQNGLTFLDNILVLDCINRLSVIKYYLTSEQI